MNDPGLQPPDWGTIFRRGRRRVLARLTLIAAVATSGALLLLGEGLSAQGAVSLKIVGGDGDKPEKTNTAKEAKNPMDKNDGERNSGQSATTEDERGGRSDEDDPEESVHPSHCKQVTSGSSAARGRRSCRGL